MEDLEKAITRPLLAKEPTKEEEEEQEDDKCSSLNWLLVFTCGMIAGFIVYFGILLLMYSLPSRGIKPEFRVGVSNPRYLISTGVSWSPGELYLEYSPWLLHFQKNGDFALYKKGEYRLYAPDSFANYLHWSSETWEQNVTTLTFTAYANLEIYNNDGHKIWESNPRLERPVPAFLELTDAGELIITTEEHMAMYYKENNPMFHTYRRVVWSSLRDYSVVI